MPVSAKPLQLHVICLNACIQTCRAHDDGRPVRRCLHNGRTIQENALAGQCPHPREDQFALQFKLESSGGKQSLFSWSIAGPLLWKELHRWALTAHLVNDNPGWLKNFTAKIACGDCREHWLRWTAANPPDFTSREKLFEWTWRAHQSVNERLGKPGMTLDAARRIWSAPAVKPVIVTKGCGGCGS